MQGWLTSRLGYADSCATATQLPIATRNGELWGLNPRSVPSDLPVACNPASPMIAMTIFWVAVVLCVIAHRYILRSAFAAGAAVQHSHTLPPIRRAAEVVWVVLPAIALVLLLAATWRAIDARQHPVAITTTGASA